jgi:hypothetical protein
MQLHILATLLPVFTDAISLMLWWACFKHLSASDELQSAYTHSNLVQRRVRSSWATTLQVCSPDSSLQRFSFMSSVLKPRGDRCPACPTSGTGVGQAGTACWGGACDGGGRSSCQRHRRAGRMGPATSADRSNRRKRCSAFRLGETLPANKVQEWPLDKHYCLLPLLHTNTQTVRTDID